MTTPPPPGCGTTHHAGCACHEASRNETIAAAVRQRDEYLDRAEKAEAENATLRAEVARLTRERDHYETCHVADCTSLRVAITERGKARRDDKHAREMNAHHIDQICARDAENAKLRAVVEAARKFLQAHDDVTLSTMPRSIDVLRASLRTLDGNPSVSSNSSDHPFTPHPNAHADGCRDLLCGGCRGGDNA